MTTLHSLLCIALAWLALSTNHCTAAPSQGSIKRATKLSDGVTCDFGTVYPFKTSSSALRFTIPFAQAPIGALRFANPQSLTKLPQGFDATKLAASCMQDGSTTRGGNAPSEDCLYMTIYAPTSTTSTSKLPILAWLPGGSFIGGSASASGLDGSLLASEQNAIIIVIQYRLGLFGWLQTQDYLSENAGGSSGSSSVAGNQAVRDVVAALQVIKRYAAQFGGDPTRITLSGQSSGAHMVRALLTTPAADSLFSQAILVSDTQNYGMATAASQSSLGSYGLQQLGCTTVACARNASAEDVVNASLAAYSDVPQGDGSIATGEPWRPFLGSYIPSAIETAASKAPKRKIISSTVSNEAGSVVGSYFEPTASNAKTLTLAGQGVDLPFARAAGIFFNNGRGDTLAASPGYAQNATSVGPTDGLRTLFEGLATDGLWRCAVQQQALLLQSAGHQIYLAQHSLGSTYVSNTQIDYCLKPGVVCHEDDITMIFGTLPSGATTAQRAASKELRARYGSFLRSGNPNASGYPTWSSPSGTTSLRMLSLGGGKNGASTVVQQQRLQTCGSGMWGQKVKFDWQLYSQ